MHPNFDVSPYSELYPSKFRESSSDASNLQKLSGTPRRKVQFRDTGEDEVDSIIAFDATVSSSPGSWRSSGTLASLDNLATSMQEPELSKNATLVHVQSARTGSALVLNAQVRTLAPIHILNC